MKGKTKMQNFKSKRKQDKINPELRRDYKLRVMLNLEELAFLDSVRGRHSRAQTIRFLLSDDKPVMVPQLNQGAWIELATSAANLNQISKKLNSGESLDIKEIKRELDAFRASLLGAKL